MRFGHFVASSAALTMLTACASGGPDAKPQSLKAPDRARALDGGTITTFPEVIDFVRPYYPPDARNNGLTGTVLVEVFISRTGSVDSVTVLKPEWGLTAAAVDAAKKWKFTPALRDGSPVAASVRVPLEFTLKR